MAREIERKFLVNTDAWAPSRPGVRLTQGYLSSAKDRIVRVRREGSTATLTIKGPTTGVTRSEFEYTIPLEDAAEMLATLCEQPLIDKDRHDEEFAGRIWQIDVFHGDNEGLVVAEVELPAENVPLVLPPWAGAEVSDDPRYFNSNLLAHPFSTWSRS
jgi:CYTH domain-containing protein